MVAATTGPTPGMALSRLALWASTASWAMSWVMAWSHCVICFSKALTSCRAWRKPDARLQPGSDFELAFPFHGSQAGHLRRYKQRHLLKIVSPEYAAPTALGKSSVKPPLGCYEIARQLPEFPAPLHLCAFALNPRKRCHGHRSPRRKAFSTRPGFAPASWTASASVARRRFRASAKKTPAIFIAGKRQSKSPARRTLHQLI